MAMPAARSKGLLIVGGVVLLLVIFFVTTYNGLVKKEESMKKYWAEVQSTYQRRLDLIPNLVNVVKGVSEFESGTLIAVTEARGAAQSTQSNATLDPDNYRKQTAAQDSLTSSVNRLIIRVEKYPVLKGTAAYSGLQTQLEGTERRIRVARNDFNGSVATYNNSVRTFPASLVATVLGFKPRAGFEAAAGSENNPGVNF